MLIVSAVVTATLSLVAHRLWSGVRILSPARPSPTASPSLPDGAASRAVVLLSYGRAALDSTRRGVPGRAFGPLEAQEAELVRATTLMVQANEALAEAGEQVASVDAEIVHPIATLRASHPAVLFALGVLVPHRTIALVVGQLLKGRLERSAETARCLATQLEQPRRLDQAA